MRRFLGLIGLMGLMGLMGFLPINPIRPINPISPISHVCAQDSGRLALRVEGSLFFIDDEYFGDRLSGYTLPGFVLQPKVDWHLGDQLTLSGGVHWLHYWGANGYPGTASYGVYPMHDSAMRVAHVLPWLQARLAFADGLTLTMGCLDADGHALPLPLYNPELLTVADPETGFSLRYAGRWVAMEVWTDWREYIWDRSPVPERFTAGASGRLMLGGEGWKAYLPLHLLVQHEGGQNMSVDHHINNNFNGAAGVGVERSWEGARLDVSCRAMWYHQHGNAQVPFGSGWGVYPEVCFGSRGWTLMASYWHGCDYVPLLGSWHFSSLSANTAGLTFDRTRVVTLHAGWEWKPRGTSSTLTVYGTLYHYLPSTGTLADGTQRDYGHRNQIAVGAVVKIR